MGLLRYGVSRGYLIAAVAAGLLAANCQGAFARDATIDVHGSRDDSSVRRLVSKNYIVRFVGINPLRYKATVNIVVTATPAPAPPAPKTPTTNPQTLVSPTPTPMLNAQLFGDFKRKFETAAGAVDSGLAKQQWPDVLSDLKVKPSVDALIAAFPDFEDQLRVLSASKPVTGSPDAALLSDATALDGALGSMMANTNSVSSAIENEGSCFTGGGETDTLIRTPLVTGITAPKELKTKADIHCIQSLTLAPGVVVGALGSPTYEAVAPLGVSPAPATVVVTERKSTLQSKTVAQLHYRIADLGESSGLHLTALGTLASTDSSGAFEGGLGISVSTLEDRLFFTIGVLGTTKQFARADAGPGHLVAPNTQIPTVPSTLYPVVFGISFKI